MADTLTSVINFITSPTSAFVSGIVLAGIVYKFFERVESVLNDETKLQIGTWLRSSAAMPMPAQLALPTFVPKWIRKVFGNFLPTERSFTRTWKTLGFLTCVLAALSLLKPNSISRKILLVYTDKGGFDAPSFFGSFFFTSLFAALGTHAVFMATEQSSERVSRYQGWRLWLLLLVNVTLTIGFLALAIAFLLILASFDGEVRGIMANWSDRLPTIPEMVDVSRLAVTNTLPFVFVVVPMVVAHAFNTVWVSAAILVKTLAGSFLPKAVGGFRWFTQTFDLEKFPLRSIGLVSGALVAVCYWIALVVNRLGVHHG